MNFLKRMAPCFYINEANIRVLREPDEFYQFITSKAKSCKKRIVVASLYIGSGDKEKSLINAIFESIQYNLNNKDFRVHLLFDSTRGSRAVTNSDGQSSSSRHMCLPLLRYKNLSKVKISFYHTPNLRGWLYKFLPQKFNEVIGLQHMKVYLFDDCLLMSGANLSDDYFTNRQDRYIVFENSSTLCDFYEELVNIVGSRSYNMNTVNELESPKLCCDPILGDFNEYVLDFQRAVENFISNQIIKSQQRDDLEDTCLTRVYPLIQMGLYDVVQDQMVLMKLLKSISRDSNGQNSVSIASGYFNLDKQNEDLLLYLADMNIPIEVLTSSPEANGFFNAKFPLKYIPDIYTDILSEFRIKSRNLPIKTAQWRKDNWTFHAKGFWISKLLSDCSRVFVTLIGSTNYGHRSCFRDLESEILIETKSDKLRKDLLAEKNRLFNNSFQEDKLISQRTIPIWIHWIVPAVKYFF